jgi:hypothetical protein
VRFYISLFLKTDKTKPASQFLDLTCAFLDGNRLAIGSENTGTSVIVQVYNLDSEEKNWDIIGKFTQLGSHADRRDLEISYADSWDFYHDAVLSADGQVLVIGTSKVSNDNYDGAIMIVTTYKWNSSTVIWDAIENTALTTIHDKPQATTWRKKCISLSEDGAVLAVCLKLGIAVYSWNEDKSAWIPQDVVFDFNKLSTTLSG